MSEFAPICIYLVISPLVSLIPLGVPFPFASNSSEKLSAYELIENAHLHLVLVYLKSEPILKIGILKISLLFKIGLLIISISWWLRIGGIEDAVVPFLSANGNPNPDPGLPPSSSGEPLGLVIADNQRQQQGETSINFLEAPSVAEEDVWDAVDFAERPLFSDVERKQILSEKMFRSHHRTDTPKGSALLEKHFLFEKTLEKHLRRCGYASKDVMRVLPELRAKLLYYNGRSRKIHELTKWVHDMELDFKGSDPYKKIKGLYIIFTSKELGK